VNCHLLDRPIWHALHSRHAHLIEGGSPLAVRYPVEVSPFASGRDDTSECLDALAAIVPHDRPILLLQREPSPVPGGLVVDTHAPAVQMVAAEIRPAPEGIDFVSLGQADAPGMLELATMTEPGPFRTRTDRFGGFIGIRDQGRLVAMAGQRLWVDGFCEVSGVCTHPDYRGRGLAGALSLVVAHRILQRGETPFLHAWAGNAPAIRLYEALGFRHRCDMHVQILVRG
jgi:predicted GNAT family acetyltransferase